MTGAVLLLLCLGAEPAWKDAGRDGEVRIEERAVEGSSFAEFRLTMTTTATPERLCEEVFGAGKFDPEEPDLISRKTLSETEHERVTYDQIDPSLVSKRDYAVRARWEMLDGGRCRMTFAAANDVAPPKPSGWVRITKMHGYWMFTPAEGGKTTMEYVIFTDPAGSIPAFIAEGGRKGSAVRWMRFINGRALKPKEKKEVKP